MEGLARVTPGVGMIGCVLSKLGDGKIQGFLPVRFDHIIERWKAMPTGEIATGCPGSHAFFQAQALRERIFRVCILNSVSQFVCQDSGQLLRAGLLICIDHDEIIGRNAS